MKSFIAAASILLSGFALLAEAHISFRNPCPRRGPYSECPQGDWSLIDYNIRSPVGTHVCPIPISPLGLAPFWIGSTPRRGSIAFPFINRDETL